MKDISRLTEELYADGPQDVLYHYTTLTGLLGIVKSGVLWASDIRYMNDSAELRHTADLIRLEVQARIVGGHASADLLSQFVDWVAHRITNGHILFGASFRSHGNLLSQWRGYSSPGKGISLGLSPESLRASAQRQKFQLGRCIYDPARQQLLIRQIVDAVECRVGQDTVAGNRRYLESRSLYRRVFEDIESDLLRIAAILKHPSFQEEEEWRLVSPVYTDFEHSAIQFREGKAMLLPYVEFGLRAEQGGFLEVDHLYLGPTPNRTISMNSLRMFLAKNGIVPRRGIDYCQIPFRQR